MRTSIRHPEAPAPRQPEGRHRFARASKDDGPGLSSFEARKRSHLRSYGSAGGQEVRIEFANHPASETKMMKLDRTDTPAVVEHVTVYLVFELSKSKWMLGVMLPGSEKLSRYTIAGGDLAALTARLCDIRTKVAV